MEIKEFDQKELAQKFLDVQLQGSWLCQGLSFYLSLFFVVARLYISGLNALFFFFLFEDDDKECNVQRSVFFLLLIIPCYRELICN